MPELKAPMIRERKLPHLYSSCLRPCGTYLTLSVGVSVLVAQSRPRRLQPTVTGPATRKVQPDEPGQLGEVGIRAPVLQVLRPHPL